MKRNIALQISEIKQPQASFCLPRDTGRRHLHRACQEEDRHCHGRGLHQVYLQVYHHVYLQSTFFFTSSPMPSQTRYKTVSFESPKILPAHGTYTSSEALQVKTAP